ncbi:hypothetical protein L596_026659 [Steinernema carpocapsae]|uniref:Transmembrane protein n=1 Tax=Steinernema carpocapsae TaxID=34508 RepID=A0A4U5M205_STECR|nr:hypothetical protein L596_026659 [Steinernema carpocapsae]
MSGPAAASTSSFVPDRSRRDVPDISTRHSDPDASLRAVALFCSVPYLINIVFIPCVPVLASQVPPLSGIFELLIVIRTPVRGPRSHMFEFLKF